MKSIGISSFTRRGFSLLELAIVLMVGGAIIGGIWVVASGSRETSRQSMLKVDLPIVVNNIRAFYGGQSGVSGVFAVLTPNLAKLSPPTFPGDMMRANGVQGCAAAFCADHPWGPTAATAAAGSFGACAWNPAANACSATAQQFFALELDGVPDNSCITAAMNNSGADAPAGLYDVVINGTSIATGAGVTHTLPPVVSDVQKLCNASSTIDFVYRLTAPQS